MAEQRFDAVVIGAGPGGYPAAIRLGQLKVKTAVIEREYMGGVCLNVGCIPSKAVIHAAQLVDKIVVSGTGSRPTEIPGFRIDQKRIIDSTGALALDQVPQRLIVIGGGYIGLELGMCYAKFGSKVTVVEALPRVLASMDKDCVGVVERKLKKMGVEVLVNTKAKGWEDKGDRAVLTVELQDGKTATLDADKILLSVGRRRNRENLGLDQAGAAVANA